MATKVTIIDGEPKEEKKKPIEFVKCIQPNVGGISIEEADNAPCEWGYIELISKGDDLPYDTMFAHDGDMSNGVLYLGHFNDGVVE